MIVGYVRPAMSLVRMLWHGGIAQIQRDSVKMACFGVVFEAREKLRHGRNWRILIVADSLNHVKRESTLCWTGCMLQRCVFLHVSMKFFPSFPIVGIIINYQPSKVQHQYQLVKH